MQDAAKKAGKDPADIGYMPFPAQKDGKFCSVVAPRQPATAVNIHSKHKAAARAWVDWFANKSGYAADRAGRLRRSRARPLPAALKALHGRRRQATSSSTHGRRGEGRPRSTTPSEIGLSKADYRQKLVDIARGAAEGRPGRLLRRPEQEVADAAKTARLTHRRAPGRRRGRRTLAPTPASTRTAQTRGQHVPTTHRPQLRHGPPRRHRRRPPRRERRAAAQVARRGCSCSRPLALLSRSPTSPVANMVCYSFTDWDGISPDQELRRRSTTTSSSSPGRSCSRCSSSACYYLVASVVQIVVALYFATS